MAKSDPKTRAPKTGRTDLLARLLLEREREIIEEHLKQHRGNVGATAGALGITRRALERKMEHHALRDGAAAMRTEAGTPGPR